ncbi:hypothetical protein D3C71_1830870 [compost metagenome]
MHPLAGTADVQIDLVIAPLRAQLRGAGQIRGLAAAQLQRQGMLLGVEAQMPRHIAMQQGARGHHLGIEQGMARQQPVQVAAMAVGPVHHGRDRHPPIDGNLLICIVIHHFQGPKGAR